MSTDVDGSIGWEHVNFDKNAQSVHADFNEGTQFVSNSFTDNSHNKYRDLEDIVYRLQITNDEIVNILVFKYVAGSTKGYTLPPGVYEITDINFMLKALLPNEVELNITIDDVRLKSNLTNNKTIKFTKKSSFYTLLGFIESHSGELGDSPGFAQLLPGTYKSDKLINITGSSENVSMLMDLLLMVPEKLFYTFLLCLHHPDVFYKKNLEPNFLKT